MAVIGTSSTDHDDEVMAAFRTVAPAVYADDPVWAPASEQVIDECLARAAAGEVAIRALVATAGAHAVARAMAIRPPGGDEGWVGLFECRGGAEDAGRTVLEQCTDWLRTTGATSVVAPRIDELRAGLLVEGVDRPHTVFTAHNPPSYLDVFGSAGFEPRTRMVAFEFTRDRAPTFRSLPLGGLTVRSPDPAHLAAEVARIEGFQAAVFGASPGRVRRTTSGSQSLARRLLPLLDLDLVVIAEDRAGDVVGVLVCLPDRWQPPPVDRARLVSIGVAPGWRGRRVAMAMAARLVDRLLATGYQSLEASWIRTDNTRPLTLLRALGATPGREFAILGRTV
jgi:GNAT superfamily N-acetyltransferase